ncbi:type II secretion system protein [Elusimicrobiota bacterium]
MRINTHSSKNGFTLVEILIVMVIFGILLGIAIPKYQKTIESSKADQAIALLQLAYTANKMYMVSNCPVGQDCFCNGPVTTVASCAAECTVADATDACLLVSSGYVEDLNNPPKPYYFTGAVGTPSTGCSDEHHVAQAKRREDCDDIEDFEGSCPKTAHDDYKSWGYFICADGSVNILTDDVGTPVPSL